MGYRSEIRKQVYTKYFSVRFKPETMARLEKMAKDKGYFSDENKVLNVKLKQPHTGVTRLIREIVENKLDNTQEV